MKIFLPFADFSVVLLRILALPKVSGGMAVQEGECENVNNLLLLEGGSDGQNRVGL
ncbi:hypothetical protein EVA_12312 [gut metagenome]|uniref:Uncharacterized protein n=1 Tax=gut metagenome TaxID=749906 RepID=J9GJ53_9ZZZZ